MNLRKALVPVVFAGLMAFISPQVYAETNDSAAGTFTDITNLKSGETVTTERLLLNISGSDSVIIGASTIKFGDRRKSSKEINFTNAKLIKVVALRKESAGNVGTKDGFMIGNIIDATRYLGNLTVYAGPGNDVIYGGLGKNYLYGEQGVDRYVLAGNSLLDEIHEEQTNPDNLHQNILDYSGSTGPIKIDLGVGNGVSQQIRNSKLQLYFGYYNNFSLVGSQYADNITTRHFSRYSVPINIDGGPGNDYIKDNKNQNAIDEIDGPSFYDRTNGLDTINGGPGSDTIDIRPSSFGTVKEIYSYLTTLDPQNSSISISPNYEIKWRKKKKDGGYEYLPTEKIDKPIGFGSTNQTNRPDKIFVNINDQVLRPYQIYKCNFDYGCPERYDLKEDISDFYWATVFGNTVLTKQQFQGAYFNDSSGYVSKAVPANLKKLAYDSLNSVATTPTSTSTPPTDTDTVTTTPSTPKDTTQPVVSFSPGAALASGTTKSSLSVTTNEAASCRISRLPSTSYDLMTDMARDTTRKSHSISVSNLVVGENNFYVRCKDLASNFSPLTKVFVMVSTSATPPNNPPVNPPVNSTPSTPKDTTPPVVSFSPGADLPSGTTKATLSVTTDEESSCRISRSQTAAFDVMADMARDASRKSHSLSMQNLVEGNNQYYIRCRDLALNISSQKTVSLVVAQSVAAPTLHPVITLSSPKGGEKWYKTTPARTVSWISQDIPKYAAITINAKKVTFPGGDINSKVISNVAIPITITSTSTNSSETGGSAAIRIGALDAGHYILEITAKVPGGVPSSVTDKSDDFFTIYATETSRVTSNVASMLNALNNTLNKLFGF